MNGGNQIMRRVATALALAIGLGACSSASAPSPVAAPIPATNGAVPIGALALTRPQQKGSIWQLVSSPNDPPDSAGLYDDQLNGVSGSSSSDVWAVGRVCCTPHGTQEYYGSLIEHWDGSSWTVVPGASNEPADVQLFAVAAVSPTDAWAFGQGAYPNVQPLIEHWDGSSWSVIPSPSIYNKGWLLAAAAISSNDIWAAGVGNFQSLTEHWDGKQWTIVPSLTKNGGVVYLDGIAASSSNDLMAVGSYSHPNNHVFAEHWNGSSWTDASPSKSFYNSRFFGVTSDGAASYWASGFEGSHGGPPQTLVERWNGSQFTRVATPNDEPKGSPFTNWLTSIAAISPKDIWAVGLWTYYPGSGAPRSLFERWNGKKWKIEAGPPPLESSNNYATNELLSIGKVNSTTLWAVGNQDVPPQCCEQTLTVQTTHG
jgi:hypothetical protein